MIFILPDPVPKTVKDHEDITAFFQKFKIVPYYGTDEATSHTILELFQTLTSYSPTFKSVVRDIIFYIFGLNAKIVGRVRPGMAIEPMELSDDQQLKYEAWLIERGIKIKNLIKVLKKIELFQEVSGNAYLLIRRIEIGGLVRYDFKAPHYRHCAYLIPQDGEKEFDFLIVSKFLGDINKMQKNPPMVLAATQEGESIVWNQTDDPNIQKAIIHLKKDSSDDESDFYARPEIIAVLDWLYTEIKLGNQSSKVAATDLITKIILAFQAPDPNTLPDDPSEWDDDPEVDSTGRIGGNNKDYFQKSMVVLKELTTEMGHHPSATTTGRSPSSIAGLEYPFSGVPPTSIPLEMNRDTKHHQWQAETAIGHICQVLRWAPELTSVRQAKSNLGGNLLFDLYTMKNQTTIAPKQVRYQDFINDVLAEILVKENGPNEFLDYGLEFPDIITEMIEKFKGTGGATIEMVSKDSAPSSQINPEIDDSANSDDSQ